MLMRRLAIVVFTLAFVACGGGGGGGSSTPPNPAGGSTPTPSPTPTEPPTPTPTPTPTATPTTAPTPGAISFSPATLYVNGVGSGAAAQFTVSEPNYSGAFTINTGSSTCLSGSTPPASISGSGPQFTVTGNAPATCTIVVNNTSTQTGTLQVNITTSSVGGQ